jgi:type II secretory pathway pseudopilin PulG
MTPCRRTRPLFVKNRRSLGLTLLELVIVMAILIAVAAILVPLLPEMLGKANQSAGATNLAELEKAVQMFHTTYNRYPSHYDSLLNESGAVSGLIPAAGSMGPAGGNMEARPLSKGQVSRLKRRGITMVYDIEDDIPADTSNFHATLNPYVAGTTHLNGRALAYNNDPDGDGDSSDAAGEPVAMLTRGADGTYNDDVFDRSVMPGVMLNPDHDYAVFGIGKYCNLCGPDGLVKDAPVFGQHKQQNTPAEAYQRFCAVFDIGPADDDTSKVNAKFVGCVAIVGKRFFTAGDFVGRYHDNEFGLSQPVE